MNKLEQFFYDHAAPSYYPTKENREDGRRRNAGQLANAYIRAITESYSFRWECDLGEHYCSILDPWGNYITSIGNVDVRHTSDPYCRVVEAELALDHFVNLDSIN